MVIFSIISGRIGDALNGMMPLLRSMDWWLDAEKYFKMMNVLAEVGANRTAELPSKWGNCY